MLDLGIPVRARDAVATARTLAAVGAVLLAVACDEPWRMPPYLAYTAEGFDPSRVAEADALGRRFAADWELVPHQGIHGMRLQPDTFTMWFFHDRKALEAFEPAVWFTIQIRRCRHRGRRQGCGSPKEGTVQVETEREGRDTECLRSWAAKPRR